MIAAYFNVVPSLWAFFAIAAALSYPIYGLRAVTSIKDSFIILLILSLFASIPTTQLSLKLSHASPRRVMECRTFLIIRGLNTLSSKCPFIPPIVTATWFPTTYAQHIVIASHYVGFTFPGIIDEPGSFSGSESSPNPHLGPEPKNLISFAIFIKETARVFKDPLNWTKASFVAKDSNLFGDVINLYPVSFYKVSATASANPIYVFNPVPTAVPP